MAGNSADDFFRKGVSSAQAGDLINAEKYLRACLQLNSEHALAALNLGIVLLNVGKPLEAEPVLLKSASLRAIPESFSALAHAFVLNGKIERAEECYRAILGTLPKHIPSLMRLAELSNQKGDRRLACKWFKNAWDADPTMIEAGIGYAIAVFEDKPAETVAALDKMLAATKDDPRKRADVLLRLLPYNEFYERMKRGLMPYHATSLDELFFTFTRERFEEFRDLAFQAADKAPEDLTAALQKFIALFCSRDRLHAEQQFIPFLKHFEGQIYENLAFDPAFYRTLETMDDSTLQHNLPPLLDFRTADFADVPVAYLSCDYSYFENFAMPMIRSLADKNRGAQLHLHIMDATDEELKKLGTFCDQTGLNIAVSVEQPGIDKESNKAARAYYHAIRFIRFYQHLKHYNRTLWLMDVDALFNRDPQALYEMMGGNDAAFRIRAGRTEPWNQFNACIVGATPSPASLRYFRLIAAYIAHFHQQKKLRWGIDQLAMYGAFEFLRDENAAPALTLLGDRAIDYNYIDDGIVWCNSGRNKFLHLERKPGVPLAELDPERAKYLRLFEAYYVPA